MFERGDIKVDERFARFGGKSYAINKINSVEVRGERESGSRSFIAWWIFAGLLTLMSIPEQSRILIGPAALCAFLGWRSWLRKDPITTFRLFLVTSSNEAQAYESNDGAEVEQLRNAIEDAMARSG